MAIEVTERWRDREFARGRFARRVFDITGVADEAEAEDALQTYKGVQVGSGFPLDTSCRIQPGGITIKRDGLRVYVATCNYETTTIESASESLLEQKWRVLPDINAIDEPVEVDRHNRPVANSFGDPFDGQQTAPVDEIRIVMWRYESTYELSKHLAYARKYNSDSVVLPKIGVAAPEELLCESIRLKDEISADADVVAVEYAFRARPRLVASSGTYHGFHRRIMDVGMRGANADSYGAPITYKEGSQKGEPVTIPVRLDGNGRPLDSDAYDVDGKTPQAASLVDPPPLDVTSDAVFLLFDFTRGPIAFSGLNIGANL